MRNLETYVKQLEEANHPAAKLGRFILEHSNSPEYLVSNLDAFVSVIQRDLDAERAFHAHFFQRTKGEILREAGAVDLPVAKIEPSDLLGLPNDPALQDVLDNMTPEEFDAD